jgi:hypothetical protein
MSTAEFLANAAQQGAAIQQYLDPTMKMCHDCAFKVGSEASKDAVAIEDAANCLAYGGMFNCHNDFLEDAGKPCVGFLYAHEYFRRKELSHPIIETHYSSLNIPLQMDLTLKETEIKLLEHTAVALTKHVISNEGLAIARQTAYETYDPNSGEELQVQIIVTRSKSDFLHAFDIEETVID